MLNIIIPMAGEGRRFKEAGYDRPKPMIDVSGKPMIERVMQNLIPLLVDYRFILIARKEDRIPQMDRATILELDKPTEGAVCTILMAKKFLDRDDLLIANCDQLSNISVDKLMECAQDGALATFPSNKSHHSYVVTDHEGIITQIKEKQVISNQAVTGIYYFRSSNQFTQYAQQIVDENRRALNEFYVSSVIQAMIEDGVKLTTLEGATAALGTPAELQLFEMAIEIGKLL